MKILDIISSKNSYWEVLGKTGGTALPDNNKPIKVNDVDIWRKSSSIRKKRRIPEAQYGPDYDWVTHPDASKFVGNKSLTLKGKSGRLRNIISRRKEERTEVMDNGKNKLLDLSDNINAENNCKSQKGNTSRKQSSSLRIDEVQTGAGLGGTGATMPPSSGPPELEFDLTKVKDEFRGKNAKADIKTNKKKRETLKQYLMKRSGNVTV